MDKEQIAKWIAAYIEGSEYALIGLTISAGNDIVVTIDRMAGVDIDYCAGLNRYLVEKLEAEGADYSLEVGSVGLTDPFVSKMQYEKHLGHDVEVMIGGKKERGQLVSVDEDSFSVDVAEKTKVQNAQGKTKSEIRIVTKTWRYEEPKYVKYDLKF